jgi:hypothetical protein
VEGGGAHIAFYRPGRRAEGAGWSREETFNGRRFRTLKGRGNEVTTATYQGGVKATGQRLESCLHGAMGGAVHNWQWMTALFRLTEGGRGRARVGRLGPKG